MQTIRLCTAALVSLAAVHAQSVTGRWTGPATTADDGLEMTVALTQAADGRITGYVTSQRSNDTVLNGKLEGTRLTLEAERPGRGGGEPVKVTYTGVIENGKLSLTLPVMNFAGRGRGGRGPNNAANPCETDGGRGATAPGPIGGRGNPQPQVVELAHVSTEVPAPLPPTAAPISLPMPEPVKPNGLAKTPPMGWNSWNKFRNQVSDKMIREIADAMVSSGMRDAGYIYVNIDDTWEGAHRDANGNITTNNKFPNMKALADYVHNKGLKLGIYSSPGPRTCAGYLGSFQHEEQDAKTWASWGIDYLKYDWCSASQVYENNSQATMAAAYAKMGNALLHSGRNIVYSLCQYGNLDVGEWGARVGGNSWRTTGDISDRWQSMDHIGFDLQPGREKYAGTGHWNDPDMLEIGNGGMTDTEYQTHMSLWSLLSSPLLAGNDIRDMTPAIRSILMNKEVVAIDQDVLGKQAVRVAKNDTSEVWAKQLHDGGVAVGLFNRGCNSARITAKWNDVGASGSRAVRDLWAHKDLGKMSGEFAADVPQHGVVLIKIAK
jgi:alpha-galactosidase